MSKKGKALIIVTAALFLALVGTATYFLVYYRFVNVPMIVDSKAKVNEARSFRQLK